MPLWRNNELLAEDTTPLFSLLINEYGRQECLRYLIQGNMLFLWTGASAIRRLQSASSRIFQPVLKIDRNIRFFPVRIRRHAACIDLQQTDLRSLILRGFRSVQPSFPYYLPVFARIGPYWSVFIPGSKRWFIWKCSRRAPDNVSNVFSKEHALRSRRVPQSFLVVA